MINAHKQYGLGVSQGVRQEIILFFFLRQSAMVRTIALAVRLHNVGTHTLGPKASPRALYMHIFTQNQLAVLAVPVPQTQEAVQYN
jgi:hypothetical protein